MTATDENIKKRAAGRAVNPSKQAILGLRPMAGKNRERVAVKGIEGLFVYVTQNGPQSFYLRYYTDGKSHWRNLGNVRPLLTDGATISHAGEELTRLAQVIATARRDMAAVKVENRDLVGDRETNYTFDELFNMWLENYAKPTRKSWPHDVERYERHYKSRLGHIVVSRHRRRDYANALDDVVVKIAARQSG